VASGQALVQPGEVSKSNEILYWWVISRLVAHMICPMWESVLVGGRSHCGSITFVLPVHIAIPTKQTKEPSRKHEEREEKEDQTSMNAN